MKTRKKNYFHKCKTSVPVVGARTLAVESNVLHYHWLITVLDPFTAFCSVQIEHKNRQKNNMKSVQQQREHHC